MTKNAFYPGWLALAFWILSYPSFATKDRIAWPIRFRMVFRTGDTTDFLRGDTASFYKVYRQIQSGERVLHKAWMLFDTGEELHVEYGSTSIQTVWLRYKKKVRRVPVNLLSEKTVFDFSTCNLTWSDAYRHPYRFLTRWFGCRIQVSMNSWYHSINLKREPMDTFGASHFHFRN